MTCIGPDYGNPIACPNPVVLIEVHPAGVFPTCLEHVSPTCKSDLMLHTQATDLEALQKALPHLDVPRLILDESFYNAAAELLAFAPDQFRQGTEIVRWEKAYWLSRLIRWLLVGPQ